ncbi:hypothetical protein BKP42_20670 [Rhodococcus erythropolis]|nr:hypothetical protein BKP42_20670 [Rhodococcus erythropolis]
MSISRSNGRSAFSNAARSVARTWANKSRNDIAGVRRLRRATVPTNIPTTSSSAGSPRPEIGVPITTSSVAARLDRRTARAA